VRDMQLRGAALAALRQPSTTGAELMAIAAAHPDLLDRAAGHANAESALKKLASQPASTRTTRSTSLRPRTTQSTSDEFSTSRTASTTSSFRSARDEVPTPDSLTRPRLSTDRGGSSSLSTRTSTERTRLTSERTSRVTDRARLNVDKPTTSIGDPLRLPPTPPVRRPLRTSESKSIDSALDEIFEDWNNPNIHRKPVEELKASLDDIDDYLDEIDLDKPATVKTVEREVRDDAVKVKEDAKEIVDDIDLDLDDEFDIDADFDTDDDEADQTSDKKSDKKSQEDSDPESDKETDEDESDQDDTDETEVSTSKDKPKKTVKKTVKKPSSKKKPMTPWVIAGVIAFLAVVLILIMALLMPYQARADFRSAKEHYETTQQELRNAIGQAEQTLATVGEDEVDNLTLLTTLESTIADANELLDVSPEMPATTKAIRAETKRLNTRREQIVAMTASVGNATSDVNSNRAQIATIAVTELMNSAQELYDTSEGLVPDDAVRQSLLTVLTAARQNIDAVNTTNHESVLETIAEQRAALEMATNAVLAVKKTKCENGTVLPPGIDAMVCGGMPEDASVTKVSGRSTIQFSLPSGDVGCTKDAFTTGAMICEVPERKWDFPDSVGNDCITSAPCHATITNSEVRGTSSYSAQPWQSNQSNGVKAPVLKVGKVADFGDVACLSTEQGAVCWDVTSHHGFRVNKDSFTRW